MKRIALALVLVVGLAGCGGARHAEVTTAQTQPGDTTTLRAYFIRDEKVGPAGRAVPRTQAVATSAMQELLEGPVAGRERDRADDEHPRGDDPERRHDRRRRRDRRPLTRSSPRGRRSPRSSTRSPSSRPSPSVRFGPRRASRRPRRRRGGDAADPRRDAAAVRHRDEPGAPGRHVDTTSRRTSWPSWSTADGTVLDKHFVTATSGSGTRGTYATTLSHPGRHDGLGDGEGLGAVRRERPAARDGRDPRAARLGRSRPLRRAGPARARSGRARRGSRGRASA